MEAMRTYNPWMTPKVHVLVHHVKEYVRRTGIQLGPTTFVDIFYNRFKVNSTNSRVFRERLLNTVLHYNSYHLKQNFIAYRSSKVSSRPDCLFEIHQLSQSGFSRVYSNCCCSGSLKH